jgi:hypothetical protein
MLLACNIIFLIINKETGCEFDKSLNTPLLAPISAHKRGCEFEFITRAFINILIERERLSHFIRAVDRRHSQQSSALISILILLLIYAPNPISGNTLYIYYIEMSRQQAAQPLACYKIFCPVASLF